MAINTLGLQSLSGLFQQFQAANMISSAASAQAGTIRTGGEIAAQGALMSAAGFRESAKALQGATQFNLSIQEMNLNRQLKSASRQSQRLLGRQTVQVAATGLATTSKSFLMLRNEALDTTYRGMLNLKVDAENRRRSTIFESQVKMVNLENQARASEYRAQAERVMAANRAAEAEFQGEVAQFKAMRQGIKAIPTLLGQFGGS